MKFMLRKSFIWVGPFRLHVLEKQHVALWKLGRKEYPQCDWGDDPRLRLGRAVFWLKV